MIVPGGGLSPDGARWVASRSNFLVHVNLLARLFSGRMLAMLADARDAGRLTFFNAHAGSPTRPRSSASSPRCGASSGSSTAMSADDRSGRVDAVYCARGLALIGMAVYHLSWDLADFRLVSLLLPFTPPMRFLSHSVASVFLALVGVSLALAHRSGLNLSAFLRRLMIIGAAAALVTLASLVFAPGEPIFFGILHCIAVASLLAAPFVAVPAWVSLALGMAAIVAPALVHSRLFDPPGLLWLGLGEALPNTVDWRPLLPWAGVVPLAASSSLSDLAHARRIG
jgi:uncharacterized membrane protein